MVSEGREHTVRRVDGDPSSFMRGLLDGRQHPMQRHRVVEGGRRAGTLA